MAEALEEYKEIFVNLKSKKNLCFELSDGIKLGADLTFAQLAKKMKINSTNSIILFVGKLSSYDRLLV